MKKPVQSFNFFYTFFRPLVEFTTRCHYHRLVIRGRDNIPTDGSYIFAPCHQNALMEPLAILCTTPRPVVFLARADIFNNPTVASILNFLKIMPVYRIRDGKENLGRNADIFEKSKSVLLDGVPFCLMAEGRHNDKHQLLPLVKGMFRIAGETQKTLGEKPLYIVPTGIDYDEYERPFSNLVVNIGKPIPVKPFMDTYNENEPLALNQMRDALQAGLFEQMHDIRSREHYSELNALCNACNKSVRKEDGLSNTAWNRFQVRRRISQRLDKMVADGCEKAAPIVHLGKEYQRVCAELKFNEKLPGEHWNLALLCLSTILIGALIVATVWKPALLLLLMCYPIILMPTHLIAKKIIKDPQFRSSVNYGIRFGISILYTIVMAVVVGINNGFWWGVLAFDAAFVIGFLSGDIVTWVRGTYDNWRYRFAQLFHRDKTDYLNQIIREVSSSMKA